MIRVAGLLAAVLVLTSCCRLLSPSCCAPVPPPRVVEVSKPCKLPAAPVMLIATLVQGDACPKDLTCFDLTNAARLAVNLSRLQTWIKEAQATCGVQSVAPASQPAKKDK